MVRSRSYPSSRIAVADLNAQGCTAEAIEVFEASRRKGGPDAVWYAPGKASNAGGVAVSGLEMAQNSQRLAWTPAEVDGKLKNIMSECYNVSSFLNRDPVFNLLILVCGLDLLGGWCPSLWGGSAERERIAQSAIRC